MSNPIIIETEILSVEDLWDAISGKRLVNAGIAAKKYSTRPLLLHEYDMGNRHYMQVAFDPDLDGTPVEWELTEGSADTWVVGFPGREETHEKLL
jgi:hypothetical protein